MAKPTKLRCIYIEWVDATSTDGWGDFTRDDVGSENCKTLGFLIKEDAHDLVVAVSVSGKQCNGIMSIPKAWIKRRRYVKL